MYWWLQFRKVSFLLIVAGVSFISQASQCQSATPQPYLPDQATPTVRFIGLRQYSHTFMQVPLAVQAGDDVGVSRVELYIDQVLFATNNVVPNLPNVLVNFNWNTVAGGKHLLQAKAFDAAGNVQTTTLVVLAKAIVPPTGNTVALFPAIKYQTMGGWEADAQAGQWASPAWNIYKNSLLDLAANDLGLNRVRLEITSGAENPTDYFAQWRAGQITESQYNAKRYEIINDNADPNQINPSGFKWSMLDSTIDELVSPLRLRLQARGESLWVNLNYVDFGSSTFEHKNNPAEYAEFVLATYQHMQSRYGFVPNSWEVILEPDTGAAWSAVQTAQAIKAAGDLLAANGFTPNFVAPSVTNIGNAPNYINQIANTAGAMSYVSEFSYHRYAGATDSQLLAVASLGNLYGKKTSMLEWIGADHVTLHQDIKAGLVSSWQQFTLAFPNQSDNGAQYYLVNDTNPNSPTVMTGARTKYLRQYFRYIRAGAQRIEALTGNSTFDPVAFINTNGKYVVVVKATNGGSFSIQNLPVGTYGIKYTTGALYNVDLTDVTISAGQSVTTNIPNPGVITVYAR